MILTFAEDFTNQVSLDSELLGTPESGLWFNRGTNPVITVDNLISALPFTEFTFTAYNGAATYGKFSDSRKRSDIVTSDSKIYQSLAASNTGNLVTDTTKWLETNIDSLRIKSFIWTSEDNMISALSLNRKLIENQYIYNVGENLVDLDGDYSAWVFEPKGTDYVKIRVNQMALQANTTDPVTVSIINQGRLIDTITLNPNNGILSFEDVGYIISGKGRFIFAFPSQEVKSNNAYNDALKYSGFVCYPMQGIGSTPEDAEYSTGSTGNGLSFNVTAYLDSSVYIENNKIDLAKFLQSQFELDTATMILQNANSQVNRGVRVLSNSVQGRTELLRQVTEEEGNTIAARYRNQKNSAKVAIKRAFDKFIGNEQKLKVKYGV